MMEKGKRVCPKEDAGTQGSSMMYVILLVTFLAVLSSGYMAMAQYNMKAALNSRNYMEAQTTAKTIHRSFCESVSSGDSEAMNLLWRCFEEDCDRVQEEFDAMMDQEEDEGRWERYLRRSLGHKEYVIRGCTPDGEDGPQVDITLTALPLQACAKVHTRVVCNGYQFSMMADIVFDDRDGAVLTIDNPYRGVRRESEDMKIYLNGNGVCRYYEDN